MNKSNSFFELTSTNLAAMQKHAPELLEAVRANSGSIRKALSEFTVKPKNADPTLGYAPALPVFMFTEKTGMPLEYLLKSVELVKGGSENFPATMAVFNSEHAEPVMQMMLKSLDMLMAAQSDNETPSSKESDECDCPSCIVDALLNRLMGSDSQTDIHYNKDKPSVLEVISKYPEDLQQAINTVLVDRPNKDSFTMGMCNTIFTKYGVEVIHPEDSPTGEGRFIIDEDLIAKAIAANK